MAKLFHAEQFTATQWATAEHKAQWANTMASWVAQGFPQNGFTKRLYEPLCRMYGHIAEFNRDGFYGVWFADMHRQLEWLHHVARGGYYGGIGDPKFTWSDVEKAFQHWVRKCGLIARYEQRCAEAIEISERALLAHLLRKYPQAAAPSEAVQQPASDGWERLFEPEPQPHPASRFRELETAPGLASRRCV